ncbi:uncharacterized protein METZ01_LOCUS293249, partial [marine metagenome]
MANETINLNCTGGDAALGVTTNGIGRFAGQFYMALMASTCIQPRNGNVLPYIADLGITIDEGLSSESWYGDTPIGKVLFDFTDIDDPNEIIITTKEDSTEALNSAGIAQEFFDAAKTFFDPSVSETYNGSNLVEYANALYKNRWESDPTFIQRAHSIYTNANFKLSQTIIADA